MNAFTHHTTPQKQFLYTHHSAALTGDYSGIDTEKLTAENSNTEAHLDRVVVKPKKRSNKPSQAKIADFFKKPRRN
jgi:hypothetical protein